MPYYIARSDLSIVVTAPGSMAPPDCDVIDGETAAACGEHLRHGLLVTPTQRGALLQGSAQGFLSEIDPALMQSRQQHAHLIASSPSLPAAGRWEYRVIPMTELFGMATAKGTASRMEDALNQLAREGWELVTTSERDSRWLGGETVMLTLRRFVVTEHMFTERFRTEERLRRQVCAELDEAGPTTG